MEDRRRLLFPAIMAIVCHGLMVSFNFSKHDIVKPLLSGNPVRIEINAFSPAPPALEKAKVEKQAVLRPLEKVQEKQVPEKRSTAGPVAVSKSPRKILKQAMMKKKMAVEQAPEAVAHEPQREKDVQPDSSVQNRKSSHALQENLPNVKSEPVPVKQTAIPRYLLNKQPPYPVMARRRGYEGALLLSVLVSSKGLVLEIKVAHSSGHDSLDTAAVTTVKSWSFIPAKEGGRPVSTWVNVPIEFQLRTSGKS